MFIHMCVISKRYDIVMLRYGVLISLGKHRFVIRPFQKW
jgi:hypothetical protein